MEFKPDNFDKEFNLDKVKNKDKKKKKNPRGKIPSWLMILAGVAVIGGVVAARAPIVQTANTTKSAVMLPTVQPVIADTTLYSGINDQQADISELEAHFASQGNSSNFQPLQSDIPDEETQESVPTPTPNIQMIAPSSKAGAQPEQSTGNPAASSVTSAEADTQDAFPEGAVFAQLNDKTYVVSLSPYSEAEQENDDPSAQDITAENQTASDRSERDSSAVNVPVTILDDAKEPKHEPQKSTFTVEDKTYILELTEIDPGNGTANLSGSPIVWLDETPLLVKLQSGQRSVSSPVNAEDESNTEAPIEVSLQPLDAEQTAALQREHFGEDFISSKTNETAEVTPEPTSTPIPEPTLTPTNESWIANVFNNIFGSNPTETPTPEVTVIVFTPTPTVVPPTATPIVVRMVPTATVQGPIRLDAAQEVKTAVPTVTPQAKDIDPALLDVDNEDETTISAVTGKEDDKPIEENHTNGPTSERIEVTILDPADSEDTAVQPTPQELPQTGMAESWNIPSLLILLAGLLLIIIGVRRLRSKG